MAGRSRATRPEFYRSEAYAKFLFNLADFHMASRFPESLTFQSNFIFVPSLTHISNFIWHIAHSTSVQLTKFQLLIANLLRCRSGPVFHIKTRGKIIRAEIQFIRSEIQFIRSGPQLEDYSPALFLLIFIIKYVIILKKDIKTPRFQLKITKNETKQRKNLSFLT